MPRKNHIAKLIVALDSAVDWFIPASLANDNNARKQARLFLISHLLGPFIGNTVPVSLYVFDPTPRWDIGVLAVSITGFWVFPFVLRAIGNYNCLALLSIQNLTFCILWSCFFYGGVFSPTLPWVLTIPILAFFYIGGAARAQTIAIFMFAFDLVVFGLCSFLLDAPVNDIPHGAMQGLGVISTIAAAAYVSMMAVYYARAIASQTELEAVRRQQIETAESLRKATLAAERAGKAKSEFLAKMSHELRTPLNAVIGYSQMLLEEAEDTGDDEDVPDIERILAAGAHLLRLVNNVLDLSKIEAGHMELFLQDFSLEVVVQAAIEEVRREIGKNRNSLSVDIAGDIPAIHGDQAKTQNALSNLIQNAAKFTLDGSISIVCRKVPDTADDCFEIVVTDTGIGIEPRCLPHIFERFAVVNEETATKYGGTGIGLALTRELCRLMGGTVDAASEPGRGSTFTLTLPFVMDDGKRRPSVRGKARSEAPQASLYEKKAA